MNRTVVLFTNSNKLYQADSSVDIPRVSALIGPDKQVLGLKAGDKLVALHDGIPASWNEFAEETRTGSLHFVYHSIPGQDDRAKFINALRSAHSELRMGVGYAGEHNTANENGKPYRLGARILNSEAGADVQVTFDALWTLLENLDPIENLLADQLDYLHAVMATGNAPGKLGTALGKAVATARKQADMTRLVEALGGKAYETSQYATFTELRDLVLGLKEPAKNP